MKIRKANKKDADVLKKMFAESLRFEKKFNDDIDLKSGIKYFNKKFKRLKKGIKYFLAEGNRINQEVRFVAKSKENKNHRA